MPEFISDFVTDVMGEGPAGRQSDVANSMMGRYTDVANTYRDQNDAIIAEYLQSLQASQDEYSSNLMTCCSNLNPGMKAGLPTTRRVWMPRSAPMTLVGRTLCKP